MTAVALFMPVTARVRVFRRNSLLMNAVYLMLSTLVVAAAGFLFWVLVARHYNTSVVGLATTLLSASSLLSLLALAGFDTTFVRFLPSSSRKNEYINSGFIIVTLLCIGLSLSLALVLPMLSPSLSLLHGVWALTSFVFFTTVTSLNVLTNAVFLAFKRARTIFIINALFSALKMTLPLVVHTGSALTIFNIAGIAQLVGLVLSVMWMQRTCDYRFLPQLDIGALRAVRKFSFSAYSASMLNLLPPTLLPLLIIYRIGPKNAAYYYMAFTIASVLYTIAYASMQSVFAEGSHDEAAIAVHVAKSAKLIAALLIPGVVLLLLLASTLLKIFGQEYASGAGMLLRLFAIGALPVAVYSALGAIFKVTKNLRGLVSMNVVYTTVILGFSFLLVPRFGLITVGWAWIVGNLAACGTGALFLRGNTKKIRRFA